MDVLVLGAGAWGTALAISAGARHRVTLWARDAAQAAALAQRRENLPYLPGFQLPPGVTVAGPDAGTLAALAARHELVIVATPMAALREMLVALRDCSRPVAWLCKGFESPQTRPFGLLGHEIRAEVAPQLPAGVLSGPSFAQEVANGQPTALVAASDAAPVRDALVAAFHGPSMRVYANDDMPGVEVGGAVKNVMAIATGLCDGLALGLNARAALVTRGLAEMTRLGVALGARAETFMGLSGLGDLVLTATGDLSRNRRVGLLLAEGRTLQQAVQSLGHVAEGVYSARTVLARAQRLGVEMPIAQGVVDLLDGRIAPAQAVAALMGRDPAAENIPPVA
jgi:glycerol-3-phosphate dehydrogenase (NAD(P)+)